MIKPQAPRLWKSLFQDGSRLYSLLNPHWQHPSRQGERGQAPGWFWQALTGIVRWTRVEPRCSTQVICPTPGQGPFQLEIFYNSVIPWLLTTTVYSQFPPMPCSRLGVGEALTARLLQKCIEMKNCTYRCTYWARRRIQVSQHLMKVLILSKFVWRVYDNANF